MVMIEIADPTRTRHTLVLAQQALKRQYSTTAAGHISKLQRMIDQLDLIEGTEKYGGDLEHGRETGQDNGGIWMLGRYWSSEKDVGNNSGHD